MTFRADRLKGLMKVKGLKRKDFQTLGFGKSRSDSWLAGTRQPPADAGFKIAEWLQVPADYLYGRLSPLLDPLPFEQVAARASLDLFLQEDRDRIPRVAHDLYEQFARSPVAPRTLDGWRALAKDIVEPSFQFAVQQQRVMRRMIEMAQPKRKGRVERPSPGEG